MELLPPQVLSVSLTPSEGEGGQDVEAEVTLSGPAAAGTKVTFESTNESAEAPEPVTIAAGSSTGQATIRTGLVVAEQTAVITALLEPTSATASLTVEPLAVTLGSISVPSGTVIGSNATVLTVTLTAAAPQQGVTVELVGGSGSPLEHVPFVTVPAGQSQVSVPVGTALEPEGASATIHARHGLTERNATLAIQQPLGKYVSAFTLATTRAVGGDLVTATLELSEPASFGTLVTLASSAPSVAIVPTKAAFPINTTTKTFIVDTEAVTEPVDVTITATYSGAVSRVRLTVVPASQTVTLEGVTIASEVTGGNDATGTVTLSGPAPAGGASVVLSGSRSGVATVPASVTVPQGATSASFVVETLSTNYPRGVLLTASYNHLVRTGVLVVNGGDQLRSVETQAARVAEVRSAPRATGTPRPAFQSETARNTFRSPTVTSEEPQRRFYFYTPELNLLAETELTADGTPTMEYEYIWFGGQPAAQIATATGEIAWYFNDHLGSPVLQTDAAAEVIWRIEREPFGKMFELRAGEDRRQPLAFPGQEEDGGETSYNIFRWYRAGWGRYTQSDPYELAAGLNLFEYVKDNPLRFTDPLGLDTVGCDGFNWSLETPCQLECCAAHDKCFDDNNCSSGSWQKSKAKCGFDLGPACQKCNSVVKSCITGKCNGFKDPSGTEDNPNHPNYYCGKLHKFFNIPGDFPNRDVAEKHVSLITSKIARCRSESQKEPAMVEEDTSVKRTPLATAFLSAAMIFIAAGCDVSGKRVDVARSNDQIIGSWKSDPYVTQMGSSVETFCFRADGTVHVSNATEAGRLENHGEYHLKGINHTVIVFTWASGSSADAEVVVDRNSLILTPVHGVARKYRRVNKNC